jgi:hypothetical protein
MVVSPAMSDRDNLLYSDIGRAIVQLVDYQFWANLDQSEITNTFPYDAVLMQVHGAMSQLVRERMFHLLSTYRPRAGSPQTLPNPNDPNLGIDMGVNGLVENIVRVVLSTRGHLARSVNSQSTTQSQSEETVNQSGGAAVPGHLDTSTGPSHPAQTGYQPTLVTQSSHPLAPPQTPEIQRGPTQLQQPISQPLSTRAPPPVLQPSPMGLTEPLPASSNSSGSSNSSTGSQDDVDMPDLSDEDLPSPNYMFDMPNSSDESSPEDPTISDPNHPNYRPLLTWQPLDRSQGQPVQIIPPRRREPPSPDGPPGTP